MHHASYATCRFHANDNGIASQTDTSHIHEKSLAKASPNGSALALYWGHLRTVADGCERLRTVANIETTGREQGSTPRPPELNENPSLRIREKQKVEESP